MFTIKFGSESVSTVSTLEEAVSLALALHRSANLAHIVRVADKDSREVIVFTRVSASRDSEKNE